MIWLISLLAIGGTTGWLTGQLTDGRGLAITTSVIIALTGSILGGFLFALFGERLIGPGPVYIVSLLAAVIGAVVLLFIASVTKRLVART